MAIAQAYVSKFSYRSANRRADDKSYTDELYDFLYEYDYESWRCNDALKQKWSIRGLQQWFLRMHTGETFY